MMYLGRRTLLHNPLIESRAGTRAAARKNNREMLNCHLCSGGEGDGPAAATLNQQQPQHLYNYYESEEELEAHLAADHFNSLPYWCDNCRFTRLPTEFALRVHYEQVHGLAEYNVSRMDEFREEFVCVLEV